MITLTSILLYSSKLAASKGEGFDVSVVLSDAHDILRSDGKQHKCYHRQELRETYGWKEASWIYNRSRGCLHRLL